MSNKAKDEPVNVAIQCYNRGDYKSCLINLNELETIAGNGNITIQHNQALVQLHQNDLKNSEKYLKTLSQLLGVTFPDSNVNVTKHPIICYNYATLLYHSRYYAQSNTVLDKLIMNIKEIKDLSFKHRTVLLLMEVCLCRRLPERAIEISKNHAELFKGDSETSNIYDRIIYRANLMLNPKVTITTKKDTMQWLFLLAHHQYLHGDAKSAIQTLSLYKTTKHNYTFEKQGEDIWASINNNLGVIYILLNKHNIAVKYFQQSVREHFRSIDNLKSCRLITLRDRPVYVFNLGLALLRANKPEGAFECLLEAARHFPNNPRLWLRLAECCVRYNYSESSQNYVTKLIGSGRHSRFVLGRVGKEKYSSSGESFAIPSLTLEFAALCLKNAVTLIPQQEPPANCNLPVLQVAPSSPLNWKQRCHLKNSVLIMNSFVLLQLQDPISALKYAKELLGQKDSFVANSHKALAHLYAAESLINLDKLPEAAEHLNPPMIHDIVSVLTPQMQDKIGVAIWANTAVCQILRGDMATARKILQQINSPRVLPLLIYMEMNSGNIENCHNILRKFKIPTI